MKLFKRDAFGNILFIKRFLIRTIGKITHKRFRGSNHLIISGSNIIQGLPDKNVLFISNHQTYFADVTAMFHVFNASINGRFNSLKDVSYLKKPNLNVYYIAAKETMNSGILPKILSYTGAITISRTWRESGKEINREIKKEDIDNVKKALNDGWLITFPQGTTKPWSPIRKGTAHIIKENRPIVVPIVIDRFRRSFDKTGIKVKKKGIQQKLTIKEPLIFNYDNIDLDKIIEEVSIAIEQHPSFEGN